MIRRFSRLLSQAWVEYQRDRSHYLAVAMIYYAILSIVPLLVLVLSVLGLLLRFSTAAAEVERQLLVAIEDYVGPRTLGAVESALDTLNQESIVSTALSLGGIVFTSSLLFRHLRHTFRAVWGHAPVLVSGTVWTVARTMVVEYVIAFSMVIGGGALLLTALVLVGSTRWLNHLAGSLPIVGDAAMWGVAALVAFVLAAMTFAPLFKFLPPVSLRWRDVWGATLVSAFGWVAASELLVLYGALFGGAGPSGILGGTLAGLLWMNIVANVLFFGAEVCKVQYYAARSAPIGT